MKKLLIISFAFTMIFACKKDKTPPTIPSVTTAALTNITTTSATCGGTITSNGGAAITASGIVWSKTNNSPSLSDSVVNGTTTTGSFTVNLANLDFSTTYYLRAYAKNSVGTGYGDIVTLGTVNDTTKVRFTYNGATITYGVIISSVTGRKWMDRNLGAIQVATSLTDSLAYGDLFNWGRLADGHQLRTSGKTSTLSTTDVPGHNNFIYNSSTVTFMDWRSPQNDNLWQGNNGINNPCPVGWHVPTKVEWDAESGITDPSSGYAQFKLVLGGYRSRLTGNFSGVNTQGYYWSSTTSSPKSYSYLLYPGATGTALSDRALGAAVRCVKN